MNMIYKSAHKVFPLALMLTLVTACGGGGDDDERGNALFVTTSGVTAPSAASINSGKDLYTQYCASCHGASIPAGKNSYNTLNAITSNRGGMAFLSGNIKAAAADDIAAYLAFGV